MPNHDFPMLSNRKLKQCKENTNNKLNDLLFFKKFQNQQFVMNKNDSY